MRNATLYSAEILSQKFGYTCVVDGDAGVVKVYDETDELLYDMPINWSA